MHNDYVDFNWLYKQTEDESTKRIISLIKEGKIDLEGKESFQLKLGKYKIHITPQGAICSLDIYQEHFKGKAHRKLVSFSGKDAQVVLDIGAHEGFYTLRIKDINPDCKIIAVEPIPISFGLLEKNVRENELENVILENRAIAFNKTKITLEYVEGNTPLSGVRLHGERDRYFDEIKTVEVDAIGLSGLYKEHELDRIDILKIDTEGSELDILQSGESILGNVDKIVLEYHGPDIKGRGLPDIEILLGKVGFDLVSDKRSDNLYFINSSAPSSIGQARG